VATSSFNGFTAAAAALCLLAGSTHAQPAAAPPAAGAPKAQQAAQPKKEDVERLKDFIHFVLIDKPDVANTLAKQLLESKMEPTAFVDLVDRSDEKARFDDTIHKAMRHPELQQSAAALLRLYEAGKVARVRNPEEIARYIGMLSGNQRARIIAQQRLQEAGEYAMPQLLNALLQRGDAALQAEVSRLMIDMGRHAVVPLSTALMYLDPAGQEQAVNILGAIPYRASLPFIVELAGKTNAERVRQACNRAIEKLGGANAQDPAALYLDLAKDYYAQKAELTAFPADEQQVLWSYNPGIGLVMQPIITPLFNQAMSMRMAERSLTLREENPGAVAVWVAANFSREIHTPEKGYDNPAWGKERRDAMYYAVAAGAETDQRVLAKGLDTRDTPLIRRALAALNKTASGNTLWGGQRSPLLESLRYPNRRVQYEAALALASAQPNGAFEGAERVVPLLASAVRDAGAAYAVVIASDQERYQAYRKTLESLGYSVLPFGRQLSDVQAPIAEVPGIDLVVAALPAESSVRLIQDVRNQPNLGATPVVVMTTAAGDLNLGRMFMRDSTVLVRPSGLNDEQFGAAVQEVVRVASGGPVTKEEARDYQARALAALRDLAVSGNTVFNVEDASLPLIGVLGKTTGDVRMQVADILSRIGQKKAQVALMDAALDEKSDTRIALLGKVSDSAKRFGNGLEDRQIKRLVELASAGSDQEATAAAGLMGALNLPNTNLVPLIVQADKGRAQK
jgi:HEAT repeat protein